MPIVGRWIVFIVLSAFMLISAGCSDQAAPQAATATTAPAAADTATLAPTATNTAVPSTPTATATTPPTATALPTETPTAVPPTATPVPPLALAADGMQIRCLPKDYGLPITSAAVFSSPDLAIQTVKPGEKGITVNIPVRACGVFLTFNQALTQDTFIEVYEGKDATPWYKRILVQVPDQANTYFAILEHEYLTNHNYWSLSYPMKVQSANQSLWQGDLVVQRPFPGLCWDGSIPDPITGKCSRIDHLEREPHPDTPTFVPGGLH